MAIGTPVNVTAVGAASGTSTATGTFDKGATDRLAVAVTVRNNAAYIDPGVMDSVGLTWTQVGSFIDGPASNPFIRTGIWVCNDAGAHTGMTVTGTAASSNPHAVHVVRVPADDPLDLTDFDSDSNGTGINTIGATVPGSPAAILTYAISQAGGAWTQPSGYSELGDASLASNSFRTAWAYDLASPGNPYSWSNANQLNKLTFGLNLKEAAAGNDISGTATLAFSNTGTLIGTGNIAGSATVELDTTGTLGGVGSLAGQAALDIDSTGTLAGTGDCAGQATITLDATGTLVDAGGNDLFGTATIGFVATGTLEPPVPVEGDDTWDALPPQPHRDTRKEREARRADVREVVRPRGITPSEPQKPATPAPTEAVNQESGFSPISPEAERFEAQIIDLQAAIAALRETRRNEARRVELQAQLEIARQAMYDEEAAIMLLLSA